MDSVEILPRGTSTFLKSSTQRVSSSTINLNELSDSIPVSNPVSSNAIADSIPSVRSFSDAYREQLRAAMAPIAGELGQVEQMIRRELNANDPRIAELLSYVADLGGKRLRPCLLLLSAKAAGTATEESIRLSVVVELVHTATLVHDDILDGAMVRRHKETVHQKWSVPASVLVGDWLFTHAYGLANKGTSTIPGRWIADAAKQVCEGEILQGNSIRHFEMETPDYLKLLDAKTGALCAVSCSLGAWSAGADESTCFRMQQYGLKMGTAFQVFDDWLDVWGQQDNAGKTLGTDLDSFKPTLPAIRTLSLMQTTKRDALIARLNNGDVTAADELRQAMDRCDASEYTKQFAKDLATDAIRCLDGIPNSPASSSLRILATAAVNRQA